MFLIDLPLLQSHSVCKSFTAWAEVTDVMEKLLWALRSSGVFKPTGSCSLKIEEDS